MMITRLILIRHGITEWNQQRRYCGCRDVSLSRQGKAQAAKLCQSLKSINFDKVYSSDRRRAVQTARIIFKNFKITRVKGLKEFNFGVFEGLSYKEIMKRHPDIYKKWLVDPFKNCIPRAEEMSVFKKRVNSAIKRIISLNPAKTIAIVCHGGTIGIFISSILKRKNFWRYVPTAASITMVEYRKGKPRIKQFNGTAHLR